MSLKSELIYWLKKADVRINRKLGQNFLIDKSALKRIVDAGEITPGGIVLEIGGGTGILTKELLDKGARVFCVEKDERLAGVLLERFKQETDKGKLTVIQHDFLKLPFPGFFKEMGFKEGQYKVISNLPYQITSPVIKALLERNFLPSSIVLTLQKEVAKRICAGPGETSSISIVVQSISKPRIGGYIPSQSFFPSPEVDSAVLKMEEVKYPEVDMVKLKKLVKAGFAFKRKMLKNNLAALFQGNEKKILEAFKKLNIAPSSRAQDIAVSQWHDLAEKL